MTTVTRTLHLEHQKHPTVQTAHASTAASGAGRIISGLVILFMIFDGVTKLMKVEPVLKAAAQLGFSVPEIVGIGIIALICTLFYAIPQTSPLGGLLLTGYLGGATAIQVHVRNPRSKYCSQVIFGVLVWAGLFARDERFRELIPLRSYR